MLYAIGEIALVVIGILIALQINTWNESRKDRIKERQVLSEILETLRENREVMQFLLSRTKSGIFSGEVILTAIDGKHPYSDTLANHFFEASWNYTVSISGLSTEGYEVLKNHGFDLIRNIDLRRSIVTLFEKSIPIYKTRIDSYDDRVLQGNNRLKELFHTRNSKAGNLKYFPFDYQEVLEDKFYYGFLTGIHFHRHGRLTSESNLIQQIEALEDLIKDELGEEVLKD